MMPRITWRIVVIPETDGTYSAMLQQEKSGIDDARRFRYLGTFGTEQDAEKTAIAAREKAETHENLP